MSEEQKETAQKAETQSKTQAAEIEDAQIIDDIAEQGAATASEGGGLGLGVTEETKAYNNVPIPAVTKLPQVSPMYPTGYKFPIARLVNVTSDPALETKNGIMSVLQCIFRDKEGRQYSHTEWEVDVTDTNFKKKVDGLNSRVKHLFVETFGAEALPKEGIGTKAKTFAEYFNIVAQEFNKRKEIYTKNSFFLKLVYFKDRLGFPLGPNFIQKVRNDKPVCDQLSINAKWDHLEAQKSDNLSDMPGMSTDAPDFDQDFGGAGDFVG